MLEFEDGTHHLSNLSFLSKLSDCTNFASQMTSKKNIIGTELATQSNCKRKKKIAYCSRLQPVAAPADSLPPSPAVSLPSLSFLSPSLSRLFLPLLSFVDILSVVVSLTPLRRRCPVVKILERWWGATERVELGGSSVGFLRDIA